MCLAQKMHHLCSIERPVQLFTGIYTPQHGYPQPIDVVQRFRLANVDQFHHQTVFDQRQQFSFGDFTQVTPEGAEQLAFRRHGYTFAQRVEREKNHSLGRCGLTRRDQSRTGFNPD